MTFIVETGGIGIQRHPAIPMNRCLQCILLHFLDIETQRVRTAIEYEPSSPHRGHTLFQALSNDEINNLHAKTDRSASSNRFNDKKVHIPGGGQGVGLTE